MQLKVRRQRGHVRLVALLTESKREGDWEVREEGGGGDGDARLGGETIGEGGLRQFPHDASKTVVG